jgi:large subunit ribosomal protein L25
MAYRKIVGTAALIELSIEGEDETQFAIIQELQRNTRTDAYLHIDFKEIVRGQEMEADIPVHTFGNADGVKNYGGVLEVSTDVTELAIGKSIHLSEIEAPEGVTFLDDLELVVVACGGASGGASGAESEEEEVAEAAEGVAEAPAEEEAATAES